MSPKGTPTLLNQDGCFQKTKYNKFQLKTYIILFNEKPANEDDTCQLVNNEKDDQMVKQVNKWNGLPNEIFEQILLLATESYIPRFTKCNTYQSIIQTCLRFKMI